jgi:hypothetical protein
MEIPRVFKESGEIILTVLPHGKLDQKAYLSFAA